MMSFTVSIRDADFRIFQPLRDDPCDSCRSKLFLGGGCCRLVTA